jgi:hypothetical protein
MELQPDYMTLSIATHFPGSELCAYAAAKGWLDGKNWAMRNYPFDHVIELASIKETLRMRAKILTEFYTKPFFIFSTIRNLKSINHPSFYFKAIKVLAFHVLSGLNSG